MSVTGWALMFLRSARNAEFNVPKQHFDEGLDFVERCYAAEATPEERKKGVFRYRPRLSQPNDPPNITHANTASAMLTLILGGRHEHVGVALPKRRRVNLEELIPSANLPKDIAPQKSTKPSHLNTSL